MSDTTKPTGKQLRYLRQLAERTGQTFTYPRTSRQASAEIDRLKAQKPSSQPHRAAHRAPRDRGRGRVRARARSSDPRGRHHHLATARARPGAERTPPS